MVAVRIMIAYLPNGNQPTIGVPWIHAWGMSKMPPTVHTAKIVQFHRRLISATRICASKTSSQMR